jgi:MSHA pilin protein MshD
MCIEPSFTCQFNWVNTLHGQSRLSSERGNSLIELIMFIVIVGIALTGIMLVMNQTSGHSADTLLRKQALAVAESLLEEIEARDFALIPTATPLTQANQASRATTYHNVMDYNGFSPTGIFTYDGTAVSGLSGYTVSAVQVVPIVANELGTAIPGGSAVRITVQVTDPAGFPVELTGYRVNY